MKLDRCKKLDQHPLTGDWCRSVELAYYHSRLSTEHTRSKLSRFKGPANPGPSHRILYLAENHEVGALLGPTESPIADPRTSWLTLSLQVRLGRVVDFCDERQRAIIGTNFQEFTGRWMGSTQIAPTQSLGEALFRLPRLEGFLAPSARGEGKVLVLFPDKLDPRRSSISFRNDLTGEAERMA